MSSTLSGLTLGVATLVGNTHSQNVTPEHETVSKIQPRTYYKDVGSSQKAVDRERSDYDLAASSESDESTLRGSRRNSVFSLSTSTLGESSKSWCDSGKSASSQNDSLVKSLEKRSREKSEAETGGRNRPEKKQSEPFSNRSPKHDQTSKLSSRDCSNTPDSSPKGWFSGKPQKLQQTSPKLAMVVGNHLRPDHPPDLHVKLILLGDYSVGKSSLLRVLARQSKELSQENEGEDSQQQQQQQQQQKQQQRYQQQRQKQHKQHKRYIPTLTETILETSTSSTSSSASEDTLTTSSQSSSMCQGRRRGCVREGQEARGEWQLVRSCLLPGEFVQVEFLHQDRRVLARVADTGGQERYRSMTTSYYRGAHGGLIMFDVTKEDSFSNLDTWIENIDRYKTVDEFPCILVGTRCKSPARCIHFERAAEFAENRGLPYMELDMDHMTDIRPVFEALLDSVTVTVNKNCAPIAISIRPNISNSEDVMVQKHIGCSC